MQIRNICAACAILVVAAGPGAAETLKGQALAMGEGTVRTFVEVTAAGAPRAIGVILSRGALAGLPPLKNATSRCFDLDGNGRLDGARECEGDKEFRLALPAKAEGGDIPVRWVAVNWNAEGHPPAAWSVPHFDFHFYLAEPNEIALIRVGACTFFINCDDRKIALKPVPAKYVAPDHVNVDATVSLMGNHLIDARAPELADPRKHGFTHTWIYGAYDGRITFLEPMITLGFLLSRPDVCTPIRQPAAWARAGYYPTRYCIRYARDDGSTTVSLEGLVARTAD